MRKNSVLALLLTASLPFLSFCSSSARVKTEPDVIFVTTPPRVVMEMLKVAALKKDDLLYDLGSGDGRIVIAAARDFGARAVGIEIDQKLIDESVENAKRAKVADLTSFRKEDIFKADIHDATVVTLFLLPGVNQMLIPKLYRELQPGTRIVSHRFDMGDWKPDVSLRGYGSDVYFWFIPANIEGDWNITVYREKEDPSRQNWGFQQTFQVARGSDRRRKAVFREIGIYGKEIEMVVEDGMGFGSIMEMSGHVDGDIMEGTAKVTGIPSSGEYLWRGVRVKNGVR